MNIQNAFKYKLLVSRVGFFVGGWVVGGGGLCLYCNEKGQSADGNVV